MTIDYDALLATSMSDQAFEYSEKDTMLYAIGVGFGSDPDSHRELPYVFETRALQTVPSMASMLLPGDLLDDYDFTLVAGFDTRFSSPVYAGDVITTEMWQDRNIVSFRCRVQARDALVIDNGKCTLAG